MALRTWDGSKDGNLADADNWDTLPTADDTALIGTAGTAPTTGVCLAKLVDLEEIITAPDDVIFVGDVINNGGGSSFTCYGTVKAVQGLTGGNYYGPVVTCAPISGGIFLGPVYAAEISGGTFYAPVYAGTVTGGTFYSGVHGCTPGVGATVTYPAVAEMGPALWNLASGVEASITFKEAMRIILAFAAGKSANAGATYYEAKKSGGGTKARITATLDSSGNRNPITLDATDP